jgi:hypothetical protein
MTTLDTLALQRSDMMLRDQHYRINTTSLMHRRLSSYQQRAISAVITSFEAILLRHSKWFFHDVGDTHALVRLRSLMPQPACSTCPLSRRTLPMTSNGVMRFVW